MTGRLAIALTTAALLLAGCGKQVGLSPAKGQSLPPKPATAAAAPSVEQLLAPPTSTRPDRNDEPLRRSEERRDDRFDLPPG